MKKTSERDKEKNVHLIYSGLEIHPHYAYYALQWWTPLKMITSSTIFKVNDTSILVQRIVINLNTNSSLFSQQLSKTIFPSVDADDSTINT